MPAAMHFTVLVSLFAVTVCTDTTTSTAALQVTPLTTAVAISYKSVSTMKTTKNTQQSSATPQITSEVTSEKAPSSPPPSTSPQPTNRAEETHLSTPPQTTPSNQTTNETVHHATWTLPAVSESAKVTAATTVNTTSPGLSHEQGNGDLAANPGLIAILCIFCIIVVLVLVVATFKCIQSPRSNFERLEDVPLGKMSEDSPFAKYSK